ncbi:MAG: alpha/beta fold hydrolase [Sciscionella sp.]
MSTREEPRQEPPSQLSSHRAKRVDIAGPYGPIAALRATVSDERRWAIAVLLPGYTGSKEDFAPLLDPIAEAGIEPLAVDLPGQYESAGPDEESAYSSAALGGVIAELVGKLSADDSRVLLLGHSYGGLVARAAVLAGAPVRGLTLLDSGPGELPASARRDALAVGELIMREQGAVAAYAIRASLNTRPGVRPELEEFFRARFIASTAAGLLGMADGLRYEADLVAMLANQLHELSMPCLVVCGENDDAWSPQIQRDMAERLDADFAVIPGAAHSPNMDNPAELLNTLLPIWRTWLPG